MTEGQVETLLGERARGTMYLGCGFQNDQRVIRLYKESKRMVLFINGNVARDAAGGPEVPMMCPLPHR